MGERYKIEVSMTPNYEDMPNKPYHWVLWLRSGEEWTNACFGCCVTPRDAWEEASTFYETFKAHQK